MHWLQHYDPLNNAALSTLVAALPVIVLLGSIAILRIRIHYAALAGLTLALLVAVEIYHMPVKAATAATLFGASYGLFPIGWIILNLIFLYQLTVEKGCSPSCAAAWCIWRPTRAFRSFSSRFRSEPSLKARRVWARRWP